MDRYDQDHDLTEMDIDLSLDNILAEYQAEQMVEIEAAPKFETYKEEVPISPAFSDLEDDTASVDVPVEEEPDFDLRSIMEDALLYDAQEETETESSSPAFSSPDVELPESRSSRRRRSGRRHRTSNSDDAPMAAQETYVSESKSSLPSEEEVRSYMAAFARGEYLDLKDQPVNQTVHPEDIDARFLMKEDYYQGDDVMMYGNSQIDSSADADYEPPRAADYISSYAPDEFSPRNEDAEEADPEPEFLGKFKRKRGKKARRAKNPPVQTAEVPSPAPTEYEEGDDTYSDTEFAASFRDYGATPTDYADYGDYDPQREINETAEFNSKEDFFPSSFKEYIFSIVTSLLYRIRGGASGSATVQDDDENLGREVSPKTASDYYGSYVKPLRLRTRVSLLLLVFMAWISLDLPVSGLLNNYRTAGLLLMAFQFTIMLLALDIVTNGILSAVRGKPGADTMAVLSCILTSVDALLTGTTDFAGAHIPLCLISSMSLVGMMVSTLFTCRGLRKALRVPAIGANAYTVSGETELKNGEVTLLKSLRPCKGFVRRAEEATPDEELFRKASLPLMILAVLLTLIIAVVKKNFTDLAYILSAVFCPAVPLTSLMCFALPYFIGSVRIFSSGAGIAGWSGLCDIGQSKNLIVTDRDLFPEGSVELENIRIFADARAENIISYAGSMLTASGCCVSSCFAELMEKNGCSLKKIENFEYLPGGGMKGIIDSSVILCGSSDLMQLMNIRIPFRLVGRTSVLLAVDGILYGIFNMKYTAQPQVRKALVGLMRSNRHPIFAIRDFNVTPEMLRGCFDVATDGYDFPPYVDRFKMSSAEPSENSKVAAVVCREGLGPLTHMADTGRSMYVTTRINMLLTVLCAVLGMLTVFIKLVGVGAVSVNFLFWFMLLWAMPVAVLSFILKA